MGTEKDKRALKRTAKPELPNTQKSGLYLFFPVKIPLIVIELWITFIHDFDIIVNFKEEMTLKQHQETVFLSRQHHLC